MLKKAMIAIIVLFTVFFIYITYVRKDEVSYVENFKTNYFGVEYTNGIYTLKAKKMIENAQDGTYTATDVQFINGDTVLKSKSAIKQVSDDVNLTGDVTGENPKNGWLIKSQELNYFKELNRVNSNQPVEAYNSIKKLFVSGDYFESTTSFDEILLDRNVNTINDNFELIGEKAFYKQEILELVNNVQIEIKSLNKSNNSENSVVGIFPGAIYDTKLGLLKATGAYQMYYKDLTISADELLYDEKSDIITSKGNVSIAGENLYGTFSEAKFDVKEDKIYFVGPINATYNNLSYTGEIGIYDNIKETFEVSGNATVTSDINVLNAGKLFYTKKTGIVEVFGEKGQFTYFGGNRELVGKYAKFYVDKNLVEVPGTFSFKYESNAGENVEGTGEALKLNTTTQSGDANKPVLTQGKNRIESQKGVIDFTKGVHKLKGKVLGTYGDYKITSEEVDYIEKTEIISIKVPYTVNSKTSNLKIWGNNIDFDTLNYKVIAKGRTNYINNGLEAYGTDLDYDLLKEEGKFTKEFYGKVPSNGIELSGNLVEFKNNSYVTLKENVKVNHMDFIGKSTNVTYNYAKETIDMPDVAEMETKDRGLTGRTQKGLYELKKQVYTGHNFKGWSERANISSDFIVYDMVKEEAYLNNNILIKDKETGTEIKGKEIVYFMKSDIVNSKEALEIKRDNIFVTAKSGSTNLVNKTLTLNKTILTTSNKDRISGDKLQANLLKNEFSFDGNIEGTLYSFSEEELKGMKEIDYSNPIKFKGDFTRAFFIENGPKQYVVTRNEIINSSEFTYKDMKLQGDFIEVENSNQKIFAKGNSKISLNNGNKLSAESITLDMLKEITNLKNNVTITNNTGAIGGINTKADKAIFKNNENIVDLEGNIESYKGKTKIQADKGIYDLINNRLNGKGNIFLSLDFETAEQTKIKQKREKELNDKILKAQKATEPPQVIVSNVNQIDLKKQHEGVNIIWKSSNEDFLTPDGRVYHPNYREKDVVVTLNATYICEEITKQVSYKVTVRKTDARTFLREKMEEELLVVDENKISVKDPQEGIKIKFSSDDEKLVDSKGNIKTDDLSKLNGLSINLLYTLEGISIKKEYRGSYINGKLKFISLPY